MSFAPDDFKIVKQIYSKKSISGEIFIGSFSNFPFSLSSAAIGYIKKRMGTKTHCLLSSLCVK